MGGEAGRQTAEEGGTEEGGRNGIFRIGFPGTQGANGTNLKEISWEEFFGKFEKDGLAMLYEETERTERRATGVSEGGFGEEESGRSEDGRGEEDSCEDGRGEARGREESGGMTAGETDREACRRSLWGGRRDSKVLAAVSGARRI